jgi:hypothetical protein
MTEGLFTSTQGSPGAGWRQPGSCSGNYAKLEDHIGKEQRQGEPHGSNTWGADGRLQQHIAVCPHRCLSTHTPCNGMRQSVQVPEEEAPHLLVKASWCFQIAKVANARHDDQLRVGDGFIQLAGDMERRTLVRVTIEQQHRDVD